MSSKEELPLKKYQYTSLSKGFIRVLCLHLTEHETDPLSCDIIITTLTSTNEASSGDTSLSLIHLEMPDRYQGNDWISSRSLSLNNSSAIHWPNIEIPYEEISYAWDNLLKGYTLICYGKKLPITKNLN
jgi:hypothetical protein